MLLHFLSPTQNCAVVDTCNPEGAASSCTWSTTIASITSTYATYSYGTDENLCQVSENACQIADNSTFTCLAPK